MAEYIAVCRTMTNKSRTAVFEFRGLTTSPEGYYESANVKHQHNMHTKWTKTRTIQSSAATTDAEKTTVIFKQNFNTAAHWC